MTTTTDTSVWDTMDHTPSARQSGFLRYLTATLVDLVVLLLFAEYWDSYVHVGSFTIGLLAAVLLQILLKVTIAIEHRLASHYNAKPGGFAKFMRFFTAWLVLFGSKFVILEALSFVFGERIRFGGPFHGVVVLIAVVVVMLVVEVLLVKLCIAASAKTQPDTPTMSTPSTPDLALERRLSGRLLDVLIRAGLVFAMAVLCYQIFAPFIALMAWSLILAVTLYPAHQKLARKLKGKQGLAATLIVVGGIVLIVAPTAMLMFQMGDSVHRLVISLQDHTLQVPEPWPSVAGWPVVGEKIHGLWSQAHTDLPAMIKDLQPKLGDFAKTLLGIVASIGGALLLFIVAFVIAGVIMAFGQAGARSADSIFDRIVGTGRGKEFATLCTATIRAVALGVLGVALIQAIVVGLIMVIASVPFAGVLALVVLILGIAQIPAMIVSLPTIVYIWVSGDYGTGAAVTYTVLLLVAGTLDNILKPFLLGRGVDAPMVVILLGALGGLATKGLLGMFVGAVVLALGYQIFIRWVANNPDLAPKPESKSAS